MALAGHFWTVAPTLGHRVRPTEVPAAKPWSTVLRDPSVGEVTLRGLLRDLPGSDTCLVVVHGLGGTTGTFYCARAARAAEQAGISCLRLALRGADRGGDDFYHAGLREDLDAALHSDALARFRRVVILGYSLGGHVTLRYALAPTDPRVTAVSAVCPPLDLALGADAIDRLRATVYRSHVLAGLKDIYAAVSRRRPVPTPLERIRKVRTIREWDSLTVVPRYGFADVQDYYARMSVGPGLAQLALPALLLVNPADPMVPPWSYTHHLEGALGTTRVETLRAGGHVGFPQRMGFSDGSERSVEAFALEFLLGC